MKITAVRLCKNNARCSRTHIRKRPNFACNLCVRLRTDPHIYYPYGFTNSNRQKKCFCTQVWRCTPKYLVGSKVKVQILSYLKSVNSFKLVQTLLHSATQSNWWRTLKLAWVRWSEEDGDQRAASFAYYLLLSLLPLTILLLAAGSLFVEREVVTQAVVNLVNHYTPLTSEQERTAMVAIREWLQARGHISLASIPLLLWGGLKLLRTLIRTTNRIWHSQFYNWWRLPVKSLSLLGITASALMIGILLPALARLLREWLTRHLAFPQWAFALLFDLVPGLVLFYGLILIYKFTPSRPTKFSEVWLGAFGATVFIWLGELLVLVYVANFSHFNALYGAMGAIVVLLLWIYFSGCVGVFGVCFCAAQAEIRENQK
jgi:YihY family inner membrane protein